MANKYNHILEVNALEWFDKTNGNSYFSATITLDDKQIAVLPFQYGYGDHYLDKAKEVLVDAAHPIVKSIYPWVGLPQYCRENRIKLITHKQENCLKKELAK